MDLDDLLMTIGLFSFLAAILFLFYKPKYMRKIDAIFICISIFIFYTSLASGYALGWSILGTILGIVTMEFFISIIYFIFRKPIIGQKWQAIVMCLFGLLFYGTLFGAIEEPTYSVDAESNNIITKKIGNATSKVKPVSTKANQKKIYNIGDNVELKDLRFKVNKVYTVQGDEFSKPGEGNEFIAIDCTVENISNRDQAVSSILMFKVVDKDGRACEYSLLGLTAAKAGQMDGIVVPGRQMTGVYVVEVAKGTKGLELEFNSSFLTGGQIVVKLN